DAEADEHHHDRRWPRDELADRVKLRELRCRQPMIVIDCVEAHLRKNTLAAAEAEDGKRSEDRDEPQEERKGHAALAFRVANTALAMPRPPITAISTKRCMC